MKIRNCNLTTYLIRRGVGAHNRLCGLFLFLYMFLETARKLVEIYGEIVEGSGIYIYLYKKKATLYHPHPLLLQKWQIMK